MKGGKYLQLNCHPIQECKDYVGKSLYELEIRPGL